jgi:hypothetical protein
MTDALEDRDLNAVARYWSARVGATVEEGIAWSYPFPIPECPKIANLVAFYNERADIWVDGGLQPKPDTPWSQPRAVADLLMQAHEIGGSYRQP